jgi:putative FmdB family regulatory protein
MPTYEYQCKYCGHELEELQSMTEEPLKTCPRCNTDNLARILSGGSGLIFKGSGFYLTDYKKGSGPGDRKGSGSAGKKDAGSEEKNDAEPAAKNDAGSAEKKDAGQTEKKDTGPTEKKDSGSAEKKDSGAAEKKGPGSTRTDPV